MRKLYAYVKKFISKHYKWSFFFTVNILLISGIAYEFTASGNNTSGQVSKYTVTKGTSPRIPIISMIVKAI